MVGLSSSGPAPERGRSEFPSGISQPLPQDFPGRMGLTAHRCPPRGFLQSPAKDQVTKETESTCPSEA